MNISKFKLLYFLNYYDFWTSCAYFLNYYDFWTSCARFGKEDTIWKIKRILKYRYLTDQISQILALWFLTKENYQLQCGPLTCIYVRINQIIYACHKVTQGIICLTHLIWKLIEYSVNSHLSAVYERITIYHGKWWLYHSSIVLASNPLMHG